MFNILKKFRKLYDKEFHTAMQTKKVQSETDSKEVSLLHRPRTQAMIKLIFRTNNSHWILLDSDADCWLVWRVYNVYHTKAHNVKKQKAHFNIVAPLFHCQPWPLTITFTSKSIASSTLIDNFPFCCITWHHWLALWFSDMQLRRCFLLFGSRKGDHFWFRIINFFIRNWVNSCCVCMSVGGGGERKVIALWICHQALVRTLHSLLLQKDYDIVH